MELNIHPSVKPRIGNSIYKQFVTKLIDQLEKDLHLTLLIEVIPCSPALKKYCNIDYKIDISYEFDRVDDWIKHPPNEHFYIDVNNKTRAKQSLYKILADWFRNSYFINPYYTGEGMSFTFEIDDVIYGAFFKGTTPIEWIMQLDLGEVEWNKWY